MQRSPASLLDNAIALFPDRADNIAIRQTLKTNGTSLFLFPQALISCKQAMGATCPVLKLAPCAQKGFREAPIAILSRPKGFLFTPIAIRLERKSLPVVQNAI